MTWKPDISCVCVRFTGLPFVQHTTSPATVFKAWGWPKLSQLVQKKERRKGWWCVDVFPWLPLLFLCFSDASSHLYMRNKGILSYIPTCVILGTWSVSLCTNKKHQISISLTDLSISKRCPIWSQELLHTLAIKRSTFANQRSEKIISPMLNLFHVPIESDPLNRAC